MTIEKRFYRGRVALNVLAKDIENAIHVYNAAEKYVLVGVLSKDYATVEESVKSMSEYGREIEEAVSIGLGAGDNKQASIVAEIVRHYSGSHVNQIFPSVGITRANANKSNCWINSLVTPSGRPGYVNISTGPISSAQKEKAIIPISAAIALVRDMGGNALKYFPMNGLSVEEEFQEVAKVCGEEGFALEPTGGIDKQNFERILRICLESNVPQIIPHIYSSIIDRSSGNTKVEDVIELVQKMKKLVDEYE